MLSHTNNNTDTLPHTTTTKYTKRRNKNTTTHHTNAAPSRRRATTASSSTRTACPPTSRSPPGRRTARSWACATGASRTSRACSSTPRASLRKTAGASSPTLSRRCRGEGGVEVSRVGAPLQGLGFLVLVECSGVGRERASPHLCEKARQRLWVFFENDSACKFIYFGRRSMCFL